MGRIYWILSIGFAALAQLAPVAWSHDLTIEIQPRLVNTVKFISGIQGGENRIVGATAANDGTTVLFIENEVIFRPESPEDLNDFLAQYGGKILRDGSVPKSINSPKYSPKKNVEESSGYYLIQINPISPPIGELNDFLKNEFGTTVPRFSSDRAVATISVVA